MKKNNDFEVSNYVKYGNTYTYSNPNFNLNKSMTHSIEHIEQTYSQIKIKKLFGKKVEVGMAYMYPKNY